MKKLLCLFFLLSVNSNAVSFEKAKIQSQRGDLVPVNLHFPEGMGKFPLLIMAPGGNYHKESPIFKMAAEKASKEGIAVLRMDWSYCKADPNSKRCTGRASEDLSSELDDLLSVLSFAQSLSRIDSKKIILSGKSLGSLVSYKVFQQQPESFYALALLTPLCTDVDDKGNLIDVSNESYPAFEKIEKPVLFLLGNQDSKATYLPHLWTFLAKHPKDNVSVSVVGGDHGLLLDSKISYDLEPNLSNLNLAIDSLVAWMKRTLK